MNADTVPRWLEKDHLLDATRYQIMSGLARRVEAAKPFELQGLVSRRRPQADVRG